ncbi:MAG: phospho-N-acetylmuramoyl-pentapeptide-transferase [candidate division Zixibacteria bacterium]|nr:phospho-N-acetylmuramoyl-pentapeptide-transferase [candidate division Zixibacteria bacterium]
MLYYLFLWLTKYISGLNLFRYITTRAAAAAVTALVISVIFGPYFLRLLHRFQVKEKIREEGPQTHKAKEGTPTMGGIMILFSILVPTLLWADLANRFILLILLVTVWMGAIGFMDDFLKAKKHQPRGLVARKKLAGQIICGLVFGLLLCYFPPSGVFSTETGIPFFKNYILKLGILYVPWIILVITSFSNAVNLSDGLDGLAIGLSAFCFFAVAALAYVSGRADFSSYFAIEYLPGSGELTVYCAAVIGSALGFLWFNAHPAQVFMGDTGALALGGVLGAIAILVKKELLLVIVGGVFVAEALSVVLQVAFFRLRGKRIFRMAPLHHHFELGGWAESKVVVRFWIVGAICALLTLSTLKIR